MRILEKDDYQLFERLVSLTHKAMTKYLKSKYSQVKITKDYIVAIGDIPIALVAHMDTVYKTPVKNLYYDEKKNLILGYVKNVISTGFTITLNGGTYVKANVSFEALDMSSGEDYESQTDAEE